MRGMMNRGENGKRFFLVMFLVCGIFYMAFVDPERIYAAPLGEVYAWVKERTGAQEGQSVSGGSLVTDYKETEEELREPQDGSMGAVSEGNLSGPETETAPDPTESSVPESEAVVSTKDTGAQPDSGEPGEIVYTSVEDDYFSDALFIGDSRIVGMFEYGGLEETAEFYAETGLTIYKLLETTVPDAQDPSRKITIEESLSQRQFGKIYMMVGINEMGTGTPETFLEKYTEVVNRIRELQPDAVLYIQGIMKVTTERSAQGDYITNEGIEIRNEGLAGLADNVKTFYLDANPVVCDETGGMEPTYTYDGVHLKAQYILQWKDFLKEHAVVS